MMMIFIFIKNVPFRDNIYDRPHTHIYCIVLYYCTVAVGRETVTGL
jgi:hypothetical protein